LDRPRPFHTRLSLIRRHMEEALSACCMVHVFGCMLHFNCCMLSVACCTADRRGGGSVGAPIDRSGWHNSAACYTANIQHAHSATDKVPRTYSMRILTKRRRRLHRRRRRSIAICMWRVAQCAAAHALFARDGVGWGGVEWGCTVHACLRNGCAVHGPICTLSMCMPLQGESL
jgi:hypothetical protein